MTSSSNSFLVRRLTSPEEVRLHVTVKRAAEGRKPGALDYVSFFAADETGFFVGELDGQVISCVSIIKYSEYYAIVGHYNVDKPYRGLGYGLQTWKTAMASLEEDCNVGLSVALDANPALYENSGFKRAWFIQRFAFIASEAASIFSGTSQSSLEAIIQPTSEAQFHDLLEYDTSIQSFSRPQFLEKWIYASNSHAFTAVNDEGSVVGYIVVRMTLIPEDGWKMGPLFADNSKIARSLYQAVFTKVAEVDPTGAIEADVPYGDLFDPGTTQIAKELSGTPTVTLLRMYTKGVPLSMQLKKIFVFTALEID